MTKTKVSSEDVLAALGEHPETSAAELAETLGLGQSTVSKHLAALEAAGTARRTPGGRDGGRRIADRWSATTVNPAAAVEVGENGAGDATARLGRGELSTLVLDYLAGRPDETFGPTQVGKALGRSQGAVANLCGSSVSSRTAVEVAGAVGISRSAASKVLDDLEREGQVSRLTGGRGEGGRRLPDRWSASARQETLSDDKGRLGRGQLRDLVVEHLRAHPGEVSPAQLSKVLGRSAGAISNALVKLVDAGDVVLTSEHPRRYSTESAVR